MKQFLSSKISPLFFALTISAIITSGLSSLDSDFKAALASCKKYPQVDFLNKRAESVKIEADCEGGYQKIGQALLNSALKDLGTTTPPKYCQEDYDNLFKDENKVVSISENDNLMIDIKQQINTCLGHQLNAAKVSDDNLWSVSQRLVVWNEVMDLLSKQMQDMNGRSKAQEIADALEKQLTAFYGAAKAFMSKKKLLNNNIMLNSYEESEYQGRNNSYGNFEVFGMGIVGAFVGVAFYHLSNKSKTFGQENVQIY